MGLSVEFEGRAEIDAFFKDLDKVGKQLPKVPKNAVRRISILLTKKVKQKIKDKDLVRTGTFRRSIFPFTVEITRGVHDGGVTTNVAYAPGLEYGTKPHTITPKNKQALAFVSKGGDQVIVKSVQHPGTKAYRVFQETLEENYNTIFAIIQEELDKALAGE